MKEIKLKIEEFFDGFIVVDCIYNKNYELSTNCFNTCIYSKIDVVEKIGRTMGFLNPNETRETIIKSLLKYQQDRLSNNWFFTERSGEKKGIWFCKRGTNEDLQFYDPETRIVTITDFSQESEVDNESKRPS